MSKPLQLSPQARREIAARALMPARTVEKAYSGVSIKPSTRERVAKAARELGLPLPPEPAPPSAAGAK